MKTVIPKNPSPLPRIDVHAHLVSAREDRGAFLKRGACHDPFTRALADSRFRLRPWGNYLFRNFDNWYVNSLVKKIQRSQYVDKVVLLAFDSIYKPGGAPDPDATLACMPNDLVFETCAAHPDVLLPGASVHPFRADALDELERCAERGTVLIKWVPNSQNIDPSDDRIVPFYEKMAALGLPLLSHTGYEHAMRTQDQSLGDPRRLAVALECGVNVIAAHAGGSGIHDPVEYFDFFIELLGRYPNLYGDMAALTWENRKPYMMRISNDMPELFGRMVHGTDYPVPLWPPFFRAELGAARALALTLSRNYFDVDVELKRAAGMPLSVLERAASILRCQEKQAADDADDAEKKKNPRNPRNPRQNSFKHFH